MGKHVTKQASISKCHVISRQQQPQASMLISVLNKDEGSPLLPAINHHSTCFTEHFDMGNSHQRIFPKPACIWASFAMR